MTQLLINAVQPYILGILQVILFVLVGVLISALLKVKGFVINWLLAHTTAKQRDTLHQLGEEAFAFAKTVYINHDGPTKLAAAVAYLSSRLREKGLNVTPDEMRAAIEKAYLAYQAIITQPIAPDQQVQIVEKTVPTAIPEEVQKLIDAASAFNTPVVNIAAPLANPLADKQS